MIKIVSGVYGHYINGRVVAKDKNSPPFSLTPEREAELVEKGIAEYFEEYSASLDPIGFDETPPDDDGDNIPAYSAKNTVKELRDLGKAHGLTFKVGMSKADMLAELDDLFGVEEAEADDEAADDAPMFDAAEAVL